MQKSRLVSQKPTLLFFIIQGRGGGSRLIQYKDASGGRKKNATTQWRRRRRVGVSRGGDSVGWLGEEQKERSYAIARAFSASRRRTWIVRLWINAIVSSVEWIRSFSSPSPLLLTPFSLFLFLFPSKTRIGSNLDFLDGWLKLESCAELCMSRCIWFLRRVMKMRMFDSLRIRDTIEKRNELT